MTDRHVLFLAIAATRRGEVVEGSAQLVNAGGTATVVVDDTWPHDSLDPRVRVVALAPLERDQVLLRLEWFLLYTVPRWVSGLIGRGPVAGWVARALDTYERRVANRVHRRIALPLYRWIRGDRRPELLNAQLAGGAAVSGVVIVDPPSILLAARLRALARWGGDVALRFSFRLDDYVPTSPPTGPADRRRAAADPS